MPNIIFNYVDVREENSKGGWVMKTGTKFCYENSDEFYCVLLQYCRFIDTLIPTHDHT